MAAFALLIFPFVTLALFGALGSARGLMATVLTGYLFLPEDYGFNLPGLPPYNKLSAISFSLLIAVALFRSWRTGPGRREVADPLFRWLVLALIALFLVSPLGTFIDNRSSIVTGGAVRPALGLRDVINMVSDTVIILIPFLLARRILVTETHHRQLLIMAVGLGLFYSLLALFEVRMSPQLNTWIYGYFQHSWVQHLRGGGFRPLVFLQHGLWLGFFLFTVAIAAFALFRGDSTQTRYAYLAAGLWFFGVLLLSYNLGATILTFLCVPLILFLPKRLQTMFFAGVAVVFMAFPFIRQAGVVPVDGLMTLAEKISQERAQSLRVRIENEEELLARALQKPAFGWGEWRRWRIYDETGRDRTTSDGRWVRILGQRGMAGYLAHFGLLVLPLLFMGRTRRRREVSFVTMGLGFVVAGNLIYMIPNSALSPVTWLLAGALAGFIQAERKDEGGVAADAPKSQPRAVRYTRFGPGEPVPGASRSRPL